jgi:hypothetical protein
MSDQTRRDWVLTIGQAAVAFTIPASMYGDSPNAAALPPGVYLPSTDHLSHALMSADQYHPIPPGCPTDYVRPTNEPFNRLFFSAAEFPVILRLIQLMLGDVADDARVSQEVVEWFDLHVSSAEGVHQAEMRLDPLHRALASAYYGSAGQRHFAKANPATICRDGIQWIREAAHAQHSREFMLLGVEQQTAILHSISDEANPKQSENSGTRFFALLKAETIRGFYTSGVGLKELNFKGNAFYARSPGCDSK